MGNHVLVINFHGGFPSCFTEAALRQMSSLVRLQEHGARVHTHAYTTNACAAASLHDLTMDAPMASMTDDCWHAWSRVRTPSRSLFDVMKRAGYKTWLMGAYGLDERLDPHRHMRPHPSNASHSLRDVGVDEYDIEDAAFTARSSAAHDADVLQRALRVVSSWDPSERHFCMINLLACQDLHRFSWKATPDFEVRVPTVNANPGDDSRREDVAQSCLENNPRQQDDTNPYRRHALLVDYMKGDTSELPSETRLIHMINQMRHNAWDTMLELDRMIMALLDVVDIASSSVHVLCDHPLGLYEHGSTDGLPWDASTRGFLLSCTAASRKLPHVSDRPISQAVFPKLLLQDAGMSPDWHVDGNRYNDAVFTLGIAPSRLCCANIPPVTDVFAMLSMWLRVVVTTDTRVYAVVFWWSIDDLVCHTLTSTPAASYVNRRTRPLLLNSIKGPDEWMRLENEEKAQLLETCDTWRLPLATRYVRAVYDLSEDRQELNDIGPGMSEDEHSALWNVVDAASEERGLTKPILIKFPPRVHNLDPDRTALSSIQVRPSTTTRSHAVTRSVHVQTDPTVHFSLPLPNEVTPYDTPVTTTSHARSAEIGTRNDFVRSNTPPPQRRQPPPQRKGSVIRKETHLNTQHR